MPLEFKEIGLYRNAILILFPDTRPEVEDPTHFREKIEDLRRVKGLGEFLSSADHLATEIYLGSNNSELLQIKTEIEEGVDPEKIRRAVTNQDFKGTDNNSAEYDRLLAAVHVKNQISREIVWTIVGGENELGLSQAEEIVTLGQCNMGGYFDVFYRKFHRDMVAEQPERAFGAIAENDKKRGVAIAKDLLKAKGITFPSEGYVYGMIKEGDDSKYRFTPYRLEYGDEIWAISVVLDKMIEDLNEIPERTYETEQFITYFSALWDALNSTSLSYSDHERLWRIVDWRWMGITGRMQPVHMMESYLDPFGVRVEPEMVLSFEDERQSALNKKILGTQKHVRSMLDGKLEGKKSHDKTLGLLDNTLVRFYSSMLSGRRLDMRAAGQNVPNREDLRIQNGVKVFMDMDTMRQRWDIQKKLLEKVFGERTGEIFSNEEDLINSAATVHVPGHEFGHNTAIQEETRVRLGADVFKDLEETKANLTALAAAYTEDGWLDDEAKKTLVKAMFGACIRDISERDDASRLPYYYSALVEINNMVEAGILKNSDGKWEYEDSSEKVQVYLSLCLKDFDDLTEIYDTMDQDAAKKWMMEKYDRSNTVQKLEEILI